MPVKPIKGHKALGSPTFSVFINNVDVTAKYGVVSLMINRRVNQNNLNVIAKATYKDGRNAVGLQLKAIFVKGDGAIHPQYIANEKGLAKILINQIGSKEIEQTISVRVDVDALAGDDAQAGVLEHLGDRAGQVAAGGIGLDDRKGAGDRHEMFLRVAT